MKRTTIAGIGVSLLMLTASPAALAATADDEFLKMAIGINLAEIEMGRTAQEKAASQEVKNFGQKLVDDHTAANEEAERLATSMNVEVPTEPSEEAQQAFERMGGLSGAEFDREFLKHKVESHETAIALFEDKSDDADNEVSNFAEENLPVLKEHLEMAQALSQGQSVAMAPDSSSEGQMSQPSADQGAATTAQSGEQTMTSEQIDRTDSASGQSTTTMAQSDQQGTAPSQNDTFAARPQDLQPVDVAQISADNLIGTTVYGANDENVGEIGDVILQKDSEEIDAVVVDVGGFLGMGEKPVAISFADLQIMQDGDGDYYIYSKFDSGQLESASAYDESTFDQNRDQMVLRSTEGGTSDPSTGQSTMSTDQSDQDATTSAQTESTESSSGQGTSTTAQSDQESQTSAQTEGTSARPEGLRPVEMSQVRTEELVGTTVYGEDNENLGEISDVVLKQDSREGDAIVVDVGGFLGIGEKSVALSFDSLEIMQDADGNYYVYSKFDSQQLENAPAFDDATFDENRDQMILRSQN